MISSDDLSNGTLFRTSDRPNGMGNATFHVQTTHHSLNLLFKFLRGEKKPERLKITINEIVLKNVYEKFDVTA
jgi:hypothetical protein